jgi:mannose-6-phosphate isomerase
MTIEHAHAHSLSKPWGVADTRPWSSAGNPDNDTIGEVWYERSALAGPDPSLLLKLLFTNQPLSIQVHPDDVYAQSNGLPNGKTEAWYVLSAAPGAKVVMGLKRRLSAQQLRDAINDGSISDLVAWQEVSPGDTISVSAGTIHAIGAGRVVAEIQQRSDTTFRLFDHGRGRELHVETAIAVADAGPAHAGVTPKRLSEARTLLTSNSHFIFERIDLAPNSNWRLDAKQETWILTIHGSARAGPFDVARGDVIFAQSDRVNIGAGRVGLTALVAYTGSVVPELLQCVDMETAL